VLALRELQLQFAAALFDDAVDETDERFTALIVPNGVAPAERIEIYRNNLREGFIKALAIAFPVIERLVGVDYFRQLARDFLTAHPSRAGNLHHAGAPFPAFLREQFAKTEYAYLADVAALERAHEDALIAANADAISSDALRDVDPAHYEHVRFDLHPACGLVQSAYPVIHIWRANQADASGEETIDLGEGGDNVLVVRTPECVEFHRLPVADFIALASLARGEPLGTALELALAVDTEFDLGAALRRFLALKIFVGVHAGSSEDPA
jgi:hypothetical protein